MDMENNIKQSRKITIFAIILSVVAIGILIFGFTLISSDKVIVLQSISNLHNKYGKLSSNEIELLNKVASSKSVGVKTNIELSSEDQKIAINANILDNKDAKKAMASLDLSVNEQELFNGTIALANEKIYGFVKDITPSYYYEAFEYIEIINSLSGDEYEKVSSIIKEAITDAISKNDLSKEKVKIDYNGSTKKVSKITYKITTKELAEMSTTFLKELKKDKKLVADMANVMDIDKDEFIKGIDASIENMSNVTEEEVLFYYQVYYYGFNKIVQYELYEPNSNTLIQYKDQKKSSFSMKIEGRTLFELTVEKNKNGKDYSLMLYSSEGNTLKIDGTYKDGVLTARTTSDEGIALEAVIKNNNTTKDNSFTYSSDITLNASIEGYTAELAKMTMKIEFYFNKDMDIDLSNSKDVNEITEEEQLLMQENLVNHPLYQMVTEIIKQYTEALDGIEIQYQGLEEIF